MYFVENRFFSTPYLEKLLKLLILETELELEGHYESPTLAIFPTFSRYSVRDP